MKKLSHLEKKIYNAGERLIPGVTHNTAELVRHRNSYLFFRRVIEHDLRSQKVSGPVRIIDLGCGVGHGCETLSDIPGSQIVGLDSSKESIEYARLRYQRENITYKVADLTEYIPVMPEYDYVISRNVFEHLPDGIQLAFSTNWRHRLLLDVPYGEPPDANSHHLVHGIDEESFTGFSRAELYFQDLDGVIHKKQHKPSEPNVILCICSRNDLPEAGTYPLTFPFIAWHPPLFLRLQALKRNVRLRRAYGLSTELVKSLSRRKE